jgi:hypothetical protein
MLLRLHRSIGTFIVMHQYAVPAEHMSATCHLWCLEFFLEANRATQLLLRVIDNLSYFVPFVFFYAFEGSQILKLLKCELCGVYGESKPTHKTILAILRAISH